jgi:hypothetical protein
MIGNTKPKRGAAFFDTQKNQNVWLYILKAGNVGLVSTDQTFEDVDQLYDAKLGDLRESNKKTVPSITSKPKALDTSEKEDKKTVNDFFDKVGLKIPFHCQECRKPLYAFSKKAKRSVSAHILPKSVFESVKTNPDNIIFLGASYIGCPCDCHTYYDYSVENRIKMKIYPVVLERFEMKLKHLLTDRELIQAYEYLNIQNQ